MEAVAPDEGPEDDEFLIQGEAVRNENITMENKMKQVLYWFGFRVASSQQALIEDAFFLFNVMIMLTEKYIRRMASDLSSQTQDNEIMNFGTRRIKDIKSFTHWVQDFHRISGLPSIVG